MKKGSWSDFGRRFLSTIIAALLVVLLIVFSQHTPVNFLVLLAVASLAGVAVWEYGKLITAKKFSVSVNLMIVGSVVLVVCFYLSSLFMGFQNFPIIGFFLFFLLFFLQHFKKTAGSIAEVAMSSFGLLYIAIPLGMIFPILYSFSTPLIEDGRWWLAYLLIVTKITDIGAYFGGKMFGRRKLAKEISPNKTLEGSLTGLVAALLASIAFYVFGPHFPGYGFTISLTEAVILGAVLGIVGQLGDLSESLFKRDAKRKDSNRLPGLGGILDMLDSLLFNIPILYLFLHS